MKTSSQYIPKESKNQILSTAKLEEVIADFVKLRRQGSSLIGKCPNCDKDAKGKGLTVNPAKRIFKCFSCDFGGKSPADFIMHVKKLTYPEALKYLADKYNINIEEEEKHKESPRKNSKIETFRDRQLKSSGLEDSDQKAVTLVDEKTPKVVNVFESGTRDQYGKIAEGDDLIIWYYNLEGRPVMFQKPKANKQEHLFRIRWQSPDTHKDKDNRPMKYSSPYGSGSHIFIPEQVREAYRNRRVIKRLFIQEGEKKALKACKHGIFSVGIMGIHNIGQNNKLPEDLQLIITECKVEEVIFVLDSDWDHLSNDLRPGSRVYLRPLSFYNAVKNYRDYLKSFVNKGIYLEIFFATIKENEQQEKGIDDVLAGSLKGKEIDLFRDIDSALNEKDGNGQFIQINKISTIPDLKLREFWHLQNIEAFVEKYKDELIGICEFKFGKYTWKFNDEGLIESDDLKKDHDFYLIEKDRDGQFRDIKIDRVKLIEKLKDLGFKRFDIDANNTRFVKILNNTITECSSTMITDQFITFIDELPGYLHNWDNGSKYITNVTIKRKIFNGLDTYFSSTLLKRLPTIHSGLIKKDTREEKYLFYKNGFVSVSKNGFEFHEYTKMDGYVWSNQILQREFQFNNDIEAQISVFEKFIKNICGYDLERIESMKTIIGYSLHNFMDCKLFAVILTDSKISQDGEANGRTGKTLWGKGLGNMLNTNDQSSVYLEVNGKDFKVSDKFKFQKANLDSQLIHINDIYNNYNIEHSFNDITEGIEVDKKNEKPFRIRPKFIFSSNKTVIIEGESAKDRVIQFEFSDYYNSEKSPATEFKHWFFTDWDHSEWVRFDHFMISCILTYFQIGLKRTPEINLSYRTLQDHTSTDFINFMDDAFNQEFQLNKEDPYKKNPKLESDILIILPGEPILKKRLFTFFINLNKDFDTPRFKQREFTKWVRRYCDFKKIKIVKEERSNGNDLFTFDFLPF